MARMNDIHIRLLQGPWPVDGNAARMLANGGEQPHNQWGGMNQVVFVAPPPIRQPKKSELMQPEFVDLRGHRVGRLLVLGLLDWTNPNKRQQVGRWVCRCDCGLYINRRAKAIKNESGASDRCPRCAEKHKRTTGTNCDGTPLRQFNG